MAKVYSRWLGASMRFTGITGELLCAAVGVAFGRFGRGDRTLLAGLEFCCALCGVEGNDDRIRGVPLMT